MEQYREINGEYSVAEEAPVLPIANKTLPTTSNQSNCGDHDPPYIASSDSAPPDPISSGSTLPESAPPGHAHPDPTPITDHSIKTMANGEKNLIPPESGTSQASSQDRPARAVPDLERTGVIEEQEEAFAMESKSDEKGVAAVEDKAGEFSYIPMPAVHVSCVGSVDSAAGAEQDTSAEPVILSVTKGSKLVPRFMFNIADGGFTELHTLWSSEKTKGFSAKTWGRRHDYWLLKAVVDCGYCRWMEICADPRFSLLNQPFQPDDSVLETKNRFLMKRFKVSVSDRWVWLCEHALPS